jgi:hydrogenase nickel incorporation protein HypB
VVVTKIDLLPHLGDFSMAALEDALGRVMPVPQMLPVSARTGEGIGEWLAWLEAQRPEAISLAALAHAAEAHGAHVHTHDPHAVHDAHVHPHPHPHPPGGRPGST